jgi:hypothetical protein
VLDLARDRVALHLQDVQVVHARQHVEHRRVLELVVGDVEHANRAACGELLDVGGVRNAVVRHLQCVEPLEACNVGDGLDRVVRGVDGVEVRVVLEALERLEAVLLDVQAPQLLEASEVL